MPRPLLPPFPKEQVSWVSLFSAVGMDHTGHIYYRGTRGQRQMLYICLFVCTTTQAVHLKVVDNLSMSSFLLRLRRLAASKGAPSVILSDNHCTFIRGEKFLLELQDNPMVKDYLAGKHIIWKHQTPRSPWMGGHFERLVWTIKMSLSTSITKKLFNWEEFVTITKEIETIVNS